MPLAFPSHRISLVWSGKVRMIHRDHRHESAREHTNSHSRSRRW